MTRNRNAAFWRIAILAAGLAALASAALSLGQSGPRLLAQAAVPTQVAGLSAEAWSGKITLTWTEPAAGEVVTHYQTCWSASSSTTCAVATSGQTAGDSGLWSGDLDQDDGVADNSYDWFTRAATSTTAPTYFWIRAKNTQGYGPISASTSVTAIAETTPAFLMPAVGPQTFLEGAAIDIAMPRVRGGDAPISYSLAVTGPSPAVTAVTPSTIGLSFDSATGRITSTADGAGGAAGVSQNATYSAIVTVTDGDGDTDTEAFDVTIENNTMPAFGSTAITAQSFAESMPATLDVPTETGGVTGGNAPLTYSVSANLPTGLSIDPSTGVISGTPAAVIDTTSAVTVTVTVTDNDNQSNSTSFDVVIANAAAIGGAALELQHPGDVYFRDSPESYGGANPDIVDLEATGGTPPYTFDVQASPNGALSQFTGVCCSLNTANGKITGTPGSITSDEARTYTIRVRDAATPRASDSVTFTMTLMSDSRPSFVAAASLSSSYVVGQSVSVSNAATGGNGKLTYSATGLTGSGLEIDPDTGRIFGQIAWAVGTHDVVVTVQDADDDTGAGDRRSRTLRFQVAAGVQMAWAATPSLPTDQIFTTGQAFTTISFPASTGVGNVTYSISTDAVAADFGGTLPHNVSSGGLPFGVAWNAASRSLLGTPRDSFQPIAVTYTAADSAGQTLSHTFNISSSQVILSSRGIGTCEPTYDASSASTATPTPKTPTTSPRNCRESYTVKLDAKPTSNVTVAVAKKSGATCVNCADIKLRTSATGTDSDALSLTFTPAAPVSGDPTGATIWSTAQTVFVQPLENDSNNATDKATLVHTPTGGGYTGVAAKELTVNAYDSGEAVYIFNPTTLEVVENAANTAAPFTARLSQAAQNSVRLESTECSNGYIRAPDTAGGMDYEQRWGNQNAATPTTTGPWNAAPWPSWDTTFTYYALYTRSNNQVGDDLNTCVEFITRTGDADFLQTTTRPRISVARIDDDIPGLRFAQANNSDFSGEPILTVPEGGQAAYRVYMRGESWEESGPRINVRPSGSGLTFNTMANGMGSNSALWQQNTWHHRHTFYVNAADDSLVNGDRFVFVTHYTWDTRPLGAKDPYYHDKWWSGLKVKITDDDATGSYGVTLDGDPGTTGTQTSMSLNEHELGRFTVVLNRAPANDVKVALTVSGEGESAVFIPDPVGAPRAHSASHTLSFSPANWNVAREVLVYGNGDPNTDNESLTITANSTTSPDSSYAALSNVTLALSVTDDRARNVSGAANPILLDVDEGGSAFYTLKPTGGVPATVTVTPQCTAMTPACSGLSFNPTSVEFTPQTWTAEQRITVTADDDDAQGAAERTATITHTHPQGSAYGGSEFTDGRVVVTIAEDDTAGLEFSAPNGTILTDANPLALTEGVAGTYRVALTSRPAANITVTVTPSLTGFTFAGGTNGAFAFTGANWNSHQTVTVTAAEDGDENDEAGSAATGISHAITVTARARTPPTRSTRRRRRCRSTSPTRSTTTTKSASSSAPRPPTSPKSPPSRSLKSPSPPTPSD